MSTESNHSPEFELQVVFLDGINKGEVRNFDSGVISFGRSPDCSVVLYRASLTVSRVHTRIIQKDNALYLENSSANGSYVNGTREQNVKLASGDVITFSESGPKIRIIYRLLENQSSDNSHQKIHIQYASFNQSFQQDFVVIGSNPDCDFEVDHFLVSPQHAILYYSDGELFIGHATEANHILVNSRAITEKTKLANNDSIELNIDGPRFKYLGSGKLIHQNDHPDTTLSPRGNEEMRTYIIPAPKPSMLRNYKSTFAKKNKKS